VSNSDVSDDENGRSIMPGRDVPDVTGMAAPHRSGSGHSKVDVADQPLVDL
jgi:hypothetical protein